MRAAFAEIVDYAGLFPPASLSMDESVRQYDRYRRSPDRWMLGRFVVAAQRLAELGDAINAGEIAVAVDDPWPVSAVLGAMVSDEMARITDFESTWRGRGVAVVATECRASSAGQVSVLAESIPQSYDRFFEVPFSGPYDRLLREIVDVGALAKIRTGGTTPDQFPPSSEVVAFLAAATAHDVRFKATAGLHHPIRADYPLTYEPDAESHWMYGFVNLLLATTELRQGGTVENAQAILDESDPAAFQRTGDGLRWRDRTYALDSIVDTRLHAFTGFGSCSFREPVDELGFGVTT